MDFGKAIRAAKDGEYISRQGWNGKGMYVYLVEGSGRIRSYLMMKAADDSLVPWLASQSDMLADDWAIVTPLPHTG